MLKVAYQVGFEMAVKEAGLTQDELEKLAKFLWYRDAAEALPTFRKLLGLSPEMGNRVAGKSMARQIGRAAEKSVPARAGVNTIPQYVINQANKAALPYATGVKIPSKGSAADAIAAAKKRFAAAQKLPSSLQHSY